MSANIFIDILKLLLETFGPGLGLAIFSICIIVYFLEEIEKKLSYVLYLFRKYSIFADKYHSKLNLQGRVNSFVKRLDGKMYGFVPIKMNIQYSSDEDLEGFESGGRYLIRVKRDINPNTNFVNVVMFFLSKHLLLKAKKQISPKQQQSIDLFVAKELLKEEKESVMSEFVDSFLQPKTSDDKIRELFDKYTNIDKSGLFFPVFLQEMVFLGERVFSNPKNHKIQEEVKFLIDFLNNYSKRKIGDEVTKNRFKGQFSKFALMIVGISAKVKKNNLNIYTDYIKILIEEKIESIYLIGDISHRSFIEEVGKSIEANNDYEVFKKEVYIAMIRKNEEREKEVENFLLVLRKKNPDPFIQN